MVLRTSTSTFALPSHSFYLSSIPFLSPISHFPPLPAFPASHLHCLLLSSNQLSVHIHLPTPIRCGIGNHYTNTLQVHTTTCLHKAGTQIITWYKPQVTGIQTVLNIRFIIPQRSPGCPGNVIYIYICTYLDCIYI